jgi:rare lipoprotein A
MTANGERFNAYDLTAAHPSLPFGSKLVITNQRNGKSIKVRINDRGPYYGGRGLDLSYLAFRSIDNPSKGEVSICYSVVA